MVFSVSAFGLFLSGSFVRVGVVFYVAVCGFRFRKHTEKDLGEYSGQVEVPMLIFKGISHNLTYEQLIFFS